jgi:hypothetical protein
MNYINMKNATRKQIKEWLKKLALPELTESRPPVQSALPLWVV